MTDLKIVTVPRDLYYHEVDYVRGLEAAARAMLAALRKVRGRIMDEGTSEEWAAVNAAIAQAESAGTKS